MINLSSPAALQPVPYKAVYSAAKTCLHNFSLALHGEWQARGILVQTLLPGPTATELDTKGGAYKSELGAARRPPAEIVGESLRRLETGAPFVTTNKGTYKQRLFAGIVVKRPGIYLRTIVLFEIVPTRDEAPPNDCIGDIMTTLPHALSNPRDGEFHAWQA